MSQLYALDWADLKSRSDANTALDVLAENLSVFKVGRPSWPVNDFRKAMIKKSIQKEQLRIFEATTKEKI